VVDAGDRGGTQGSTAAAPPPLSNAPIAAPPRAVTIDVARVTIFDRARALKGDTRAQVIQRLTSDLNGVRGKGKPADNLLKQVSVRFEVVHIDGDSRPDDRLQSGRLDFHVYLMIAQTGPKEIESLMAEYGVRRNGEAGKLYPEARKEWERNDIEGLGIPPLTGYRKCGFIKSANVAKASKGNFLVGFVNVIKHELGHMLNITTHADTGVMRAGVMLVGDVLDYTESNASRIYQTLNRLRTVSAADLDKQYQRDNP
jgi:hypothetical protein